MTSSSTKTGLSTGALKVGTGSATLENRGSFTGEGDLEYIVAIDSVAGGVEIGQATFKWSDGLGSWNATGVLTSTSYTALNNGIEIKFIAGTGDDFKITDTWYFKTIQAWSVSKTIDSDRDTRYRSNTLEYPNTLTFDLQVDQQVQALILYDHNITSAATITLKANSSDSWGAPPFSEAVGFNSTKLVHYLTSAQTYRYWRLEITDAAIPENYLEISEIFLGQYLQLNTNFSYASGKRAKKSLIDDATTPYGVVKKRFFNSEQSFTYAFDLINDIEDLKTMFNSLGDRPTGIIKPLYFHENYENADDFWLVYLEEFDYVLSHNQARSTQLTFAEVLRSV